MRFQDGLDSAALLAHLRPLLINADALKGVALPELLLALDDPERSGSDSLTVVGSQVRLEVRNRLQAGLVLAEDGVDGFPPSLSVLRIANAHKTLAALVNALAPQIEFKAPFLEGDVSIGEGAYIGAGSFIGSGTRIEPRAVVQSNCIIGKNCAIQSGAVIGCAGFGFFDAGEGTEKSLELMPHLAGVQIGDNCFIGANTVIAAGVLHPTEIGDGCKLDSHVQIAHNVRLGRGCLLASQSGIAGSTVVGDGLRMGGAASIAGHLRLGNNVSVAAKSGVTKDLPDGSVVAGFPARPIREWRKTEAALRRLTYR